MSSSRYEIPSTYKQIIHTETTDGIKLEVSSVTLEYHTDRGLRTRYETVVFGIKDDVFLGCFKAADLSMTRPCGPAIAEEVSTMTYEELLEADRRRWNL